MFKIFSWVLAMGLSLTSFAGGYDPIDAFSKDPTVIKALGDKEVGKPQAIRILRGNAGGGSIEGYVVAQSIKDRGDTKSVVASVHFTPAKTVVALIKVVPLEVGRKSEQKNPIDAFEKDKAVIERVGKSKADPAEAALLSQSGEGDQKKETHLAAKLIHRPAGNPAPSSSIIGLVTVTSKETNVQIVKLVLTN